MNPFTFESPTRMFFGEGQIKNLANEIPLDKKVLVTYGGGSIKKNGVYDQVKDALKNHNWDEFHGIKSNPQYDILMEAVAKIKAEGFDYLLAVGGGSVIDGTKFISAAAKWKGGDPWDILTDQAPISETLPIGVVLTIPATGSETNVLAVISRGKDKLCLASPLVRPKFAIMDPKVSLSLSPRQVANGVVDAFVHVMEQYMTYPVGGKVQDRFSEGVLSTLVEEGPKALAHPEDMDVRNNIMLAASWALNGLLATGVPQDWSTHWIGHEITGIYGIDHGRSLTIVFPALLQYCRKDKGDKIAQFGERVFGITSGSKDERIDATIAKTIEFFKSMGVPTHLSDVQLNESHIDEVVQYLAKHKMTHMGEHEKLGPEDAREILKLAL
ncbi:iron-containing alcohol dehydrogenase [Desulfobaculum bizertense]|uniref:NADP-dependent alcohol dehydrogenase n=1 Tax=Desulfobaculum bizertense DSM 18034 TaxID=1121442 RepID=A0A1T4VVN6_9BACT|nr:iron-containing alcohol dehydrogenase [Desulfobaculum bizertense]SKA69062.1 NADP-dependent alcohol dehydrogenase [Desulfobaculum bizertense DSM 18034]